MCKQAFYMAEKKGFEPPHAFTSSGFRNRPLQPLGYFSNAEQLYHRNRLRVEGSERQAKNLENTLYENIFIKEKILGNIFKIIYKLLTSF